MLFQGSILKSEAKKRDTQKLAIDKKSSIFVLSSWNLVKVTTSWDDHFHQVSWEKDKNCGSFINGQFLTQTLVIYCAKKESGYETSQFSFPFFLYACPTQFLWGTDIQIAINQDWRARKSAFAHMDIVRFSKIQNIQRPKIDP